MYDGHGGSEVAQYCSTHLPQFLRNLPSYSDNSDLSQTLKQLFLDFDASLTTAEVCVDHFLHSPFSYHLYLLGWSIITTVLHPLSSVCCAHQRYQLHFVCCLFIQWSWLTIALSTMFDIAIVNGFISKVVPSLHGRPTGFDLLSLRLSTCFVWRKLLGI